MEAFAAYTAQTDFEVGRVLDALERIGSCTYAHFWIIGDNGSSLEGSLYGCFNEMPPSVAYRTTPPSRCAISTRSGAERVQPLSGWLGMGDGHAVPVGQASRLASRRHAHPMVVAWPDRIKTRAASATSSTTSSTSRRPSWKRRRSAARVVNGVKQKPIEGVSMMYSFDDASAKGSTASSTSRCSANRALYATVGSRRAAWSLAVDGRFLRFREGHLELYDLAHDFSEADDLAAKHPDKLKELQNAFWTAAQKYQSSRWTIDSPNVPIRHCARA